MLLKCKYDPLSSGTVINLPFFSACIHLKLALFTWASCTVNSNLSQSCNYSFNDGSFDLSPCIVNTTGYELIKSYFSTCYSIFITILYKPTDNTIQIFPSLFGTSICTVRNGHFTYRSRL